MPSINDVFNQLQQVNGRLSALESQLVQANGHLQGLRNDLTQLRGRVDAGFDDTVKTLNAGFTNASQAMQTLAALESFTNQILAHQSAQNDTIICILEKISRNTCNLVSESHIQTGLQTSIQESTSDIRELAKSAQPEAALELQRIADLRRQVEKCCPPAVPPPACTYEPCEAHRFTGEPPREHVPEFRPVVRPNDG